MYQKRIFVSLTDLISTSEYYALIGSKNGNEEFNFPVVIGTSLADIETRRCIILSDVLEVGVKDNLPLENIRMIMVPSDKLLFVRKIVGDKICVMPLDDIDNKFFYINAFYGIEVNEERLEEFKRQMIREKKVFRRKEIKEMVLTRPLRSMKESLDRIKEMFLGEEDMIYEAKTK
jgi:hypothetical protein